MQHGARRYFGGYSNLEMTATNKVVLRSSFGYTMQELEKPFVFANGSGAARLIADGHLAQMRSQLNVKPRKTLDHMNLLATINRRVAAAIKDKSVSPFCHVSFINADDHTPDGSPGSQVFLENGESVPFEMPVLLFGIDLSGMAQRFHEQATASFRGELPSPDPETEAMNEELKRRP